MRLPGLNHSARPSDQDYCAFHKLNSSNDSGKHSEIIIVIIYVSI